MQENVNQIENFQAKSTLSTSDSTKPIFDENTNLTDREKQFHVMEAALRKLEQQNAFVTSLIGKG